MPPIWPASGGQAAGEPDGKGRVAQARVGEWPRGYAASFGASRRTISTVALLLFSV